MNFNRKSSSGFTLIELLVVVAIIGLLASIVLVSLSSARNKGVDASVKSNLKNALTQGEVVFNTRAVSKNTYTDVCINGLVPGETSVRGVGANMLSAAQAGGLSSYATNAAGTSTTVTCNDGADDWAAEAPLKSGGMWCVDSTGNSKEEPGTSLADSNDHTCI